MATPVVVSVVLKGCGATTTAPPVRALNKDDLPLLGRPTKPRRSTAGQASGSGSLLTVSKRTNKRKLSAKKKANHGKKPNCGRG